MMALEDLTGSDKFIDALVPSNPEYQDDRRQGDDHIRGVKNVLANSFPNIDAPVTATPARLSGALNNGDHIAAASLTLGSAIPQATDAPRIDAYPSGGGFGIQFAARDAATNGVPFYMEPTGLFYATAFQSLSDARLKANIERISPAEAREILDRLSAYRYSINGRESIGLLAQEVATVAPEAVGMTDDKYLSLDYNAIVALLVAARG
jgi:Chaperone of endosialidase